MIIALLTYPFYKYEKMFNFEEKLYQYNRQQCNRPCLFEFQKAFSTENDCLKYLSSEKWKDGFIFKKGSNTSYCNGIKNLDRQCTKCRYLEPPTAETLFHKAKSQLKSPKFCKKQLGNYKIFLRVKDTFLI
jgi:hypothetical protein